MKTAISKNRKHRPKVHQQSAQNGDRKYKNSMHDFVRERVDAGADLSILSAHDGEPDRLKPELTGGRHVLLEAGDVVLTHAMLAHRVGNNCSPHIRYQVIFKLNREEHDRLLANGSLLESPWAEFAGLEKDVAGRAKEKRRKII